MNLILKCSQSARQPRYTKIHLESLILPLYWINSAACLTVFLYFLCISSFGNTFLRPYYTCWSLPPCAACCSLCRKGCAGACSGCLLASEPQGFETGILSHTCTNPVFLPVSKAFPQHSGSTLLHIKHRRFSGASISVKVSNVQRSSKCQTAKPTISRAHIPSRITGSFFSISITSKVTIRE